MADIPFSLITNATDENNGTGYFDILMKTVNMHVNQQYETNRITGAEYATVYLGAMQSAMAEAMKFALTKDTSEAQTKLLEDQDAELLLNGAENRRLVNEKVLNEADKRLSTAKARDVQEAQRKLYARQLIGFDDSKNIKAFEAQTNAWALFSSSGMDTAMPSIFSDSNLSHTYNKLTTPTNTSNL